MQDQEYSNDDLLFVFDALSLEDIDTSDQLVANLGVDEDTALLHVFDTIEHISEKRCHDQCSDSSGYTEDLGPCRARSSTVASEGRLEPKFLESLMESCSARNSFIIDVFFEASGDSQRSQAPTTTSRRCLLDTGADLNLITADALKGLQFDLQSIHRQQLRGLAGTAEILNTIGVDWHLKRSCDLLRLGRLNRSTMFHVVDPKQKCTFDCVLGRPWIEQNKLTFLWIFVKDNFLPQGRRKYFS